MNINKVYALYFSPAGATRALTSTLATALAESFAVPMEVVDVTLPAAREESCAFAEGDLVVCGSPTYAGKLPLLRIDYAWANDGVTPLNFKRHRYKASDHYPIILDFAINK